MNNNNNTKEYFLKKAEENFPQIYYEDIHPSEKKIGLKTGDNFVLDLGKHCVGKFSFAYDNTAEFNDAPLRLIIKFAEDLKELEADFSKYKGTLCKTWLQEEIIVLDYPQTAYLPRRYSCRFIKITVDGTRQPADLFDFCFTASTSADITKLRVATPSTPLLTKIDNVATTTLKECMQTFFEDGPKRDRRLWIGDFRLEALTNYYTFNNLDIVKRCFYLFAGGNTDSLGFLPSYIYETPYFFSGRSHIADYALLYVVALCDYYEHTSDEKTVYDLLSLCKEQLDSFEKILDENLIVTKQEGWFSFIDWCPGLSGLTALQGVYLYTLEKFIELLKKLGDNDFIKYEDLLTRVCNASRKHLFNEEKGIFVNKLDGEQISVHSQVWMILGGVIGGKTAVKALEKTIDNKCAKQPFTPYMWHYVIEAMLKLGLKEKAVNLINEYWGGMIELSADTFYEAFVPSNPDFSPYGDRMINSLCHAWSCTPSYFIRKYNL